MAHFIKISRADGTAVSLVNLDSVTNISKSASHIGGVDYSVTFVGRGFLNIDRQEYEQIVSAIEGRAHRC